MLSPVDLLSAYTFLRRAVLLATKRGGANEGRDVRIDLWALELNGSFY